MQYFNPYTVVNEPSKKFPRPSKLAKVLNSDKTASWWIAIIYAYPSVESNNALDSHICSFIDI